MVQFFNIIFDAFWQLVNIQIPIDNGLYITPWSIFLFMFLLSLIIKFVKRKSESE